MAPCESALVRRGAGIGTVCITISVGSERVSLNGFGTIVQNFCAKSLTITALVRKHVGRKSWTSVQNHGAEAAAKADTFGVTDHGARVMIDPYRIQEITITGSMAVNQTY